MTLEKWLLLPAFVHVALVLGVGVAMGRARFRAAREGRVEVRDVVVDSSRWPDDVRKFANNYQNQFEIPVLFYAALALIVATGVVDAVMVVLAWLFVVSRIVHSAIHTGTNVIMQRFQAFLFGFAAVVLLWAWFGLRLYVTG